MGAAGGFNPAWLLLGSVGLIIMNEQMENGGYEVPDQPSAGYGDPCDPDDDPGCFTLYKAPKKDTTDKLLKDGFKPEDFPKDGPYADGKAYFGFENKGKEIALDYSTRGGYDPKVLQIRIPRADFEKYFREHVQNYDAVPNGQVGIPNICSISSIDTHGL